VALRAKAQEPDPSLVIPVVARTEVPAAPLIDMVALQRTR